MENQSTETGLALIVSETGLEKETANAIIARFSQYMERIGEWEEKATALVVTDISQVDLMKQAREARLILKNIRVEADRVRKELKEDSLRYGKAVQRVYNEIEYRITPIEEYLLNQEKFAEYAERDRMNALRAMRQDELRPYQEYVPLSLDLATLSDEEYAKFCGMVQAQHAENLRHIAETEQKRKEAAEAAEKERQRLAKENAALIEKQKKLMAAQREAARIADEKLAAERKAAEEKLAAERETARVAREAADALRRQEEARVAQQKAEEAARKRAEARALRAPDLSKMLDLATTLDNITIPSMKSAEMQQVADNARLLLNKTATYIRQTLATINK